MTDPKLTELRELHNTLAVRDCGAGGPWDQEPIAWAIAAIERMNWTSVKDDLPKKDGFYWCYLAECPPQSYPQKAIRFTRAQRNVCAGLDDPDRWWTSWVVSHWMELPESPRCQHQQPTN